jgi:glycosyltransferase involved in cell wall biosynthesis
MNTAQPLVTIGIPTYNRADSYLKKTIHSALRQTYRNIEIIISDNCSNDDTENVVKSFPDSRIRYFRQEVNIGPIENYNFCLSKANGDYFLLLHDDDLIDEDFVEICMARANSSTSYGIIRTGTRLIDAECKTLGEFRNQGSGTSIEEYFRAWFTAKTVWYLPSTLFSTNRLKEVGGFNPEFQLLPDVVAVVKLGAKFQRLDIEEIKASFRKHSDELTYAARVKDWCDEYLRLLDVMCDLGPEGNPTIRTEGMRFFCSLNYDHARAVKSALKRFFAYLIVFKKFKYNYPPPFVRRLIYKNPIHFAIRKLKRELFSL